MAHLLSVRVNPFSSRIDASNILAILVIEKSSVITAVRLVVGNSVDAICQTGHFRRRSWIRRPGAIGKNDEHGEEEERVIERYIHEASMIDGVWRC